MSADVHKYGYASKGVSVILYRTHEPARKQLFVTTDWLGGFHASTAMAGTRPAGPVAAAWAAMMHIGRDGYLELTRTVHDAALMLRAGIESIDGLPVRGDPPATVLAFGAAIPTCSTSSPSASGWLPRAGTSTGRIGPIRSMPRCTPAVLSPCRRWSPTCAVRSRRSARHRTERRDTTYGQTYKRAPRSPRRRSTRSSLRRAGTTA